MGDGVARPASAAGRRDPRREAMAAYAAAVAGGARAPGPAPGAPSDRGRLSRRELLRAGGILAIGGPLAACTPARDPLGRSAASPSGSRSRTDARVVVVGAGLAGLTAAFRLHRAGVRAPVFEARERLGGRCWSLRFPDGRIAEHGGEFIDTRHVHLRGLVQELGLELEDLWEGWMDGSASPTLLDGERIPRRMLEEGEQALIDELVRAATDAGIVVDGRFRPASIAAGTATPGAVEIDRASAEEWVERRLPGFWRTATGRALSVALAGWYGLSPGGLGALNLVDYFLIPWRGADERYHVRGGNDRVIQRLAEELPDDAITLSAPLEALVERWDGSYELVFGGGVGRVLADRVILALPFTTLRRVDLERSGLSPWRREAIERHAMGMNTKLHLHLSLEPETFLVHGRPWSGSLTHVDAGWVSWEAVKGQPGRGGVLTIYGGGDGSAAFAVAQAHGPAPARTAATAIDRLDAAIPGIAAAVTGTPYLDFWPADPWSIGSYAAFGPGQMTRFWGATYRSERGVHFAGEHTSTYSQGFLNGGVESGQRAAIEVMRALGMPIPERLATLPYTPSLS